MRKSPEHRRLAALNAPPRFAAVIRKCLAIVALAAAMVVIIGDNSHIFGPPLIALLLTALVAAGLVSLRPRLFLAPLGAAERKAEQGFRAAIGADPLFLALPSPGLLVECETREILAANPSAEELYGYPPGELSRLSLAALLSAVVNPGQVEADIPASGLARHRRADGSAFWAELQIRRIEHLERPLWLMVIADVSARMNLVQELEGSERFAFDLVDLSLGIVFSHDLDGTLQMVNPAFARALGLPTEELAGRNLAEFLLPRQRDAFTGYLSNLDQDPASSGVVHLRKGDGGELVWEFRHRLRIGADGGKSVLCCAVDISERTRNERRLLESSRKDPLTGCYNRRHLQVFEEDAEPASRWAAIVIDIDHLKRYNDTHGHRIGDQAIISTARTLEGMVRSDDSVVRLGGDEFVILLRRCDQATLESFALRLQRVRDNPAGVPFTFGMAMRKDAEDLEETIHRADRQLIERRVIERSSIRLGVSREARLMAHRRPLSQRLPNVPVADAEVIALRDAEGSA